MSSKSLLESRRSRKHDINLEVDNFGQLEQ